MNEGEELFRSRIEAAIKALYDGRRPYDKGMRELHRAESLSAEISVEYPSRLAANEH